jgi:hypothetical protein
MDGFARRAVLLIGSTAVMGDGLAHCRERILEPFVFRRQRRTEGG